MALQTQLQIRQNAMEVQEYLTDLFEWERGIKQSEARATASTTPAGPLAPPAPRGKAGATAGSAPAHLRAPGLPRTGKPAADPTATHTSAQHHTGRSSQSAAAHTYSSYSKWDKLTLDSDSDGEQQPHCSSSSSSSKPPQHITHTASAPAPHSTQPPPLQPTAAHAAPPAAAAVKVLPRTSPPLQMPCSPHSGSSAAPAAHLTPLSTTTINTTTTTTTAAAAEGPGPQHSSQGAPTAVPPVRGSEPESAEGWRKRGNELFKAGQWAMAKDCYTQSIGKGPSDAAAWANRAMVELKLCQWAEAIEDCSQALHLDPTYVKARHRRATAHRQQGHLTQALQDFEDAYRYEPGNKSLAADRDAALAAYLAHHRLAASTRRTPLTVVCAPQPPAPAAPAAATTCAASTQQPQQALQTPPLGDVVQAQALLPGTAAAASQSASGMDGIAARSSQASRQASTLTSKQRIAAASSAAVQQVAARLSAALKPPRTSTDFEGAWRSLKGDTAGQVAYLARIEPGQLPAIFKSSLTPPLLASLLRVLLTHAAQCGDGAGSADSGPGAAGMGLRQILALLQGLASVQRCDMAAMCIGSKERAELKALWADALCSNTAAVSEECRAQVAQLQTCFKL